MSEIILEMQNVEKMVFRIMLFQIDTYLFSYPYPQTLLVPDDIWLY